MKPHLTKLQVSFIALHAIVPITILGFPTLVIGYSRQDGWLSMLAATTIGLLIAGLVGSITRQNPGQPFLLWMESRFGRVLSTLIGLILSWYYLTNVSFTVREFATFISDQLLSSTPIYIITAIMVLVAVYMVSQGIEVIARINVIVAVISFIMIGLNIVLLSKEIHWNHFQPLFESSLSRILAGSLLTSGWISQMTVLLLLSPYMGKPSDLGKAAFWGTALSGLLFTLSVTQIIAVFGTKIVPSIAYPVISMIGIIEAGRFLERVDVFFLSVWMTGMFIQVSILMFGFMHCITGTFRIRRGNPLLMAFGVLILTTALFSWTRKSNLYDFIFESLTPYFFINNVLLLILIWFGLRFTRHKAQRKKEGS